MGFGSGKMQYYTRLLSWLNFELLDADILKNKPSLFLIRLEDCLKEKSSTGRSIY